MRTELLLQQTTDAYTWTNRLLESLPIEKWEISPPVIGSNALWQAGHLLVSFYYHSILVIRGHQQTILQSIPLKLYGQLFTQDAPATAVGQVNPYQLAEDLKKMQEHSLTIIKTINEEELLTELEPTGFVHPVANNKLGALDWNIKHTLWHCGQLALIKRVIDARYQFDLQLK
ncbi:hypothetical protein LLH06_10310 [Mucilaginibacter daejeonensis]|uniref:DinB family protein n=1 Tax=Mucilaginibacter daejeonensis TaxID=398049 RepID=UPI001D174D51|nr:DinB family protein [Mucilaginibacter daejeonensis]UEG51365.1 hypothetical protein LLH06_10310 [Mucilaginibacter daejeonensis]